MDQPPKTYKLELRITVREEPYNPSASGLGVEENLLISASSFMEVASVLAKFHELALSLRPNYVRTPDRKGY